METEKMARERGAKQRLLQKKEAKDPKPKPANIPRESKSKTPVQGRQQPSNQQNPKELSDYLKKRKEEVERAMGHRKFEAKNQPKTPEIKKPASQNPGQINQEVKRVPLTGKSPRQIVKKELAAERRPVSQNQAQLPIKQAAKPNIGNLVSRRPVTKQEVTPVKKPLVKAKEPIRADSRVGEKKPVLRTPISKIGVKQDGGEKKEPKILKPGPKPNNPISGTPIKPIDPLKAKFLERKFAPQNVAPDGQPKKPAKKTSIPKPAEDNPKPKPKPNVQPEKNVKVSKTPSQVQKKDEKKIAGPPRLK